MTGAQLLVPGRELTLMPWVRFDDQYPIHRKVAGLSDTAFRLHSAAIFWCARNGTNGFVPEEDLDQVCAQVRAPARFAAECVNRGTWHVATHACESENCPAPRTGTGWVLHDYLEYQPTKEEAEAAKEKQREQKSSGGRLGNHRRWHEGRNVADPSCPWCKPSVSDRNPIGPSDRSAIAPSRPDLVTRSLDHHPADRNARAREPDDDDSLIAAVVDAVLTAHGVLIGDANALNIAGRVLERAGRAGTLVQDRARFVAAAVANEPDLYSGLLLPVPPPLEAILAEPLTPPPDAHEYVRDPATGVCRMCDLPEPNQRHLRRRAS